MKTIELSTASRPLCEYTNELEHGSIVLLSHNTPVAVMVSVTDVDLESLALSMSPEFYNIIRHARQEVATGKTISLADMKREIAEMD